jgi:VanZ family protein
MANLRWKNLVLPGLYYAAILCVSLLPQQRIESVPLPNDKFLHLAAYGGLGFLLAPLPAPAPVLAVVGALCGALDEQVQRLSPGRHVSMGDWLADVLGVGIGLALGRALRR